jgi:HEAT repeat protein
MMRGLIGPVLLLCSLACVGCSSQKSTDELIADLKSGKEGEGVTAARTLPNGKDDAAKVVPALIEALNHNGNDIRRSAALKLGVFREQAKDAIPALQKAEEQDGDARVREAAGISLSRIDPERFPYKPKVGSAAATKKRTGPVRRAGPPGGRGRPTG